MPKVCVFWVKQMSVVVVVRGKENLGEVGKREEQA